jgi:hypothetical protein
MKPGTLVHHPRWGKGLVTEASFPPGHAPYNAVLVLWNKPIRERGVILTSFLVYEEELTIISEVAE